MANLYEILANSQDGDAIAEFGRQFGLTSQQTQAAVAALLPAISMGLKQSTATPEGLGTLFATFGRQPDLYAMYENPEIAFSRDGRQAGNAVLATMFGSPDASRAIADQAQNLSGVTSSILKKLLPVLAGIIISGLMRSKSGQATPTAPQPSPEEGGGALIDILRQIFKQGGAGPAAPAPGPTSSIPPIGDILDSIRKTSGSPGSSTPAPSGQPAPIPTDTSGQQTPIPTEPGGQIPPGGDLLSQILREFEEAIRDGRLKPVVIGPYEIDIPGQAGPANPSQPSQPQAPGGDILGQILRDILGGGAGQAKVPGQSAGAAVFGNLLEPGHDVDDGHIDSLQEVLDRFLGAQRR